MAALQQHIPFRPSQRLLETPRRSAEVIVIGAGLSGLQAAIDCHQAGLTCLVLEAQTYLKSHSSTSTFEPLRLFDGSSYISFERHPRLWKAVRRSSTNMNGAEEDAQLQDLIENLDQVDRASFSRVQSNLEALCRCVNVNTPSQMLPNYGATSVHELVVSHGATERIQSLADEWTTALFGRASADVSALDFLLFSKTHGGVMKALPGSLGVGGDFLMDDDNHHPQLLDTFKAMLPHGTVFPSHQVVKIEQSTQKCVLTTSLGDTFMATKVILAMSPHDYQHISFSPDWSPEKEWIQHLETSTSDITGASGSGNMCTGFNFTVPSSRLRDLEHDHWQPEEHIHFAGADTSHVCRGHSEGALAAGTRAAMEVIEALRPIDEVRISRL